MICFMLRKKPQASYFLTEKNSFLTLSHVSYTRLQANSLFSTTGTKRRPVDGDMARFIIKEQGSGGGHYDVN